MTSLEKQFSVHNVQIIGEVFNVKPYGGDRRKKCNRLTVSYLDRGGAEHRKGFEFPVKMNYDAMIAGIRKWETEV